MEARELRIGNWVQDDIDRAYPIKASQLYNNEVFGRWPIQINPIPITEEWLVRFGIHINGQSILLKSGTIGVIQRGREGMFKYYLQSSFGMVHLDSIKYVHQLQNLYFALTGEELELK